MSKKSIAAKQRQSTRFTGIQAAKSTATRQAAIQGAIDCFVTLGFDRSSTIEIAKRARVSRGAMIYHFPTKRKLLEAAVGHIMSERIHRFTGDLRREVVTREDRLAQRGVDVYWKNLQTRLFKAYHELVVASRTDAELGRVMRTASIRFDRERAHAVRAAFPEWADKGAMNDLAMDLTQFLLEGMAMNTLSHDVKRRRLRIREYLKARLQEIFAMGESGTRGGARSGGA